MAFDLSTPGAQLAFGVAQRAQEVQDYKDKLEAEARARVEARLAPYGNNLSQFDSTFKGIYDPAVATQQSRAKAMQEYVIGLPELLARAQRERSAGSGSGVSSSSNFVPQPYVSPEDYLNWLLGNTSTKTYTQRTGSADSMSREAALRPGSAVKPTFQRTINADRFG